LDAHELKTLFGCTLHFEAQFNCFANAFGDLIQRPRLGMTAGKLRDRGDIICFLVALNNNIELALQQSVLDFYCRPPALPEIVDSTFMSCTHRQSWQRATNMGKAGARRACGVCIPRRTCKKMVATRCGATMPSKSDQQEPVVATLSADSGDGEAAAIRRQLDRVLASPHLCQSKRCQVLLRYVVEACLEGCREKLKERCIGFEVFRRDADYDTSRDSVVRTTAAEVRKRLAQYYLETGHEHEIRIVLPHGSYSPEFRMPPSLSLAAAPAPLPSTPARGRRFKRVLPLAVAVAAAGAAAAVYAGLRPTELDLFWKPLLQDRSEAVICIEQPLRIFRFVGPRKDELNDKMVGAPLTPPASGDVRESTPVKLADLEPIGGAYFTYGDLMATARLSELLARKSKPFQVFGDRLTSFRDLRGRPAILLGQFNNQWTLGLTSGLRYYLNKNAAGNRYEVRDRQNPEKTVASVPMDHRSEEYAIISRIFDVQTEKTVIALIGTSFLGTLSGSEFLTRPAYMQEAFRHAPSNWYRKNIQVVIVAAMVGGAPGPPRVIATHFW
jgi:hypothetical protein